MTEFFKSIPPEIVDKLREYVKLYSTAPTLPLEERISLNTSFVFLNSPEGKNFWFKHVDNRTFPRWSEELNRFIDDMTTDQIKYCERFVEIALFDKFDQAQNQGDIDELKLMAELCGFPAICDKLDEAWKDRLNQIADAHEERILDTQTLQTLKMMP